MSDDERSFVAVDADISFRASAMEGERNGNLAEGSAEENLELGAGLVPPTRPLGSLMIDAAQGFNPIDNTKQTTISNFDFSTLVNSQKQLQDTVTNMVRVIAKEDRVSKVCH